MSVNMQQLTKVEPILGSFKARPGHVLVDSDLASLEPRVIAYFSQDPTYIKLYASGQPHDPYLYNAAFLFPDRRAAMDAVYRFDAPTETSVNAAKAQFKFERKVAKEVTLAAVYGAGVRKIYQTMRVKGISVTLDEVAALRARYWELYAGVKDWERSLQAEREDRGGWIYNGRGRPLVVTDFKVKDISNVFVQSTGHDCLLTLIMYVEWLRRQRNVPMWPWLVDVHDETVWETPEEHADDAVKVMQDAYRALNDELKSGIPLVGNVDVGGSFWEFKK